MIRRLWCRWMAWNTDLYAASLERSGIDAFHVRREAGAYRCKEAMLLP